MNPIEFLITQLSITPSVRVYYDVRDSSTVSPTFGAGRGDDAEYLSISKLDDSERFEVTQSIVMGSSHLVYRASSQKTALRTFSELRLPTGSTENEGERCFKILRDIMMNAAKTGSCEASLDWFIADPLALKLVLNKLIHVYSGRVIDESFYRQQKKRRAESDPPPTSSKLQ